MRRQMVGHIQRLVRGYAYQPPRLTQGMVDALYACVRAGREQALNEAEKVGVDVTQVRQYAVETGNPLYPYDAPPVVWPFLDRVKQDMARLEQRINAEYMVAMSQQMGTADDITEQLLKVPGVRNIAATLPSKAFTTGLADIFDTNADAFGGFAYTAILDGGTCDACAPMDGNVYPTWADAQDVMPGGGPNPFCYGGTRCRCRLVPLPPEDR